MSSIEQVGNYFLRASKNEVIQHIFFWVLVISAFIVAKGSFRYGNSKDFILLISLGLIVPILAAYTFNYFFFAKRKNPLVFLLLVCCVYVFSALTRIVVVHIVEPLLREGDFIQESVCEIMVDYISLLETYIPAVILISFSLAFMRQQKIKRATVKKNLLLEKEKAEAELKFLKAQINPHFLFNTLNSLYVLSLKKSEEAPKMIIRLSEILEYNLYRGKDKLVPLEKEVRLLENYIALEKMRYAEDIKVNFEKDVDHFNTPIAPLLLITLVENAFKHGASGVAEKRIVSISLEVKLGQLKFDVFNTTERVKNTAEVNQRKGIGLSNLRNQLSLLYEEFQIKVEAHESTYRVEVWINLKISNANIPNSPEKELDDPFPDNSTNTFFSAG